MSKIKPSELFFKIPNQPNVDLLVIAGEHSGDELAAKCIKGLFERHPGLNIVSIGGAKLEKEGTDLIFNLVEHSVVGFIDVFKKYPFFRHLFEQTISWIEVHRPKHICFVDYPGFNLRLSKALRKKRLSLKGGGSIRLHYYVSPQIWIWKSKRRFEMAKNLDGLACLLPFEKECYSDTNLPVSYVGHSFADKSHQLMVSYNSNGPILMLPGSRFNSVKRIAPIIFQAFIQLSEKFNDLDGIVIYPSDSIKRLLEGMIKEFPQIEGRVTLVNNESSLVNTRAVIMSSGTMSLNMALASIPGVIIYSLSPINYWLVQSLGKIGFIGLANLILDQNVYPELLQKEAKSDKIVAAITPFLTNKSCLDNFIDASNLIRHKLNDERDESVSEWLESQMDLDVLS